MANLFKGYIESIGKKPIHDIIGGKYLESPPEYGDYVGVLKEGIIQIDFDTEEDMKTALAIVSEYKMKCDILKTTRGIHLYFNNTNVSSGGTHIFTAIGIPCDVGLGDKNRVIPLRVTAEVESIKIVNGEEVIVKQMVTTQREWLQTYDELDELPACFKPITKNDYELRKSNTRNQTLFNYILTLQYHGFGRDDIRRIIKIVNKYILYEPLPEKEIDMITRDEAFSEDLFFQNDKFLHDRFGNYMLANCNIVKIDNQAHIYTHDQLYSNDPNEFEKIMLDKIPSLKDSQRKEVYKYVMLKVQAEGEFANPRYIGLKDNIMDIQTGDIFPYSPKWIINNRIPFSYKEDAYDEVMDRTLDKVCLHDPQVRALLEEMVGYTLYRKNSMQSCFILTGEGSNGKSTILNVIKRLLGKQNYTSLDLRELEETFKPAEMYNKLANIGDDISAKFLENSSVFKKVVTGESFVVQRKYAQPFEMESYATQIFCSNELPQVHDRTDGFSRRIIIVPFNAKFSKTDPDYDPFIEDKLLTDQAVEYLLKLGIEGLKRLLYNKHFTKSDRGEAEKKDYDKLNNNVVDWFEDEPQIENQSVADVYMMYQVWCTQNGCMPIKKINFSKEIKKMYGFTTKIKSISGKSVRIYAREEL